MFALLGGLGGLVRGLLGVRKALLEGRTFVFTYLLSTVLIAIIIGAIVGSVLGNSTIMAFVAGYAGTDLLESLAKSIKLVPLKIGEK
ncbi:hypothetical protein COV18_05785 [Candidatus Woesearchaeota archaeon CG10_big_fil_rev_8_21_14_0_10_37_12]|nr:MAG: hypothetical protein COV18_05785 [Candidatus Woesearchaeota archaeon CG10_big_fil_rev_8_21_14_0_10_37_12]